MSRTAAKRMKADGAVMAALSEVRGVFTLKEGHYPAVEAFSQR